MLVYKNFPGVITPDTGRERQREGRFIPKRLTQIEGRGNNIPTLKVLAPPLDRLRYLSLPTLKYRRLRGDMLETYKILNDLYDNEAAPVLELSGTKMTRKNDKKLNKVMSKMELSKHFFTQRVVDVWNSLPSEIINSASVNIFKNRLDTFWKNQEIYFDYKADIAGTGNRSWI